MNERADLKKVGVYTANEYLFQKIRLELSGFAETVMLSRKSSAACDFKLVDADDPQFTDKEGITMKRGGGDVSIPFRIGELSAVFKNERQAFIEILTNQKSVRIGEKAVKLTELEYALFELLFTAGGKYVSREDILSSVWGGRAEAGIINVYVHYLREKLEADGKKIILSSRNYGYKINEKYLGGNADA